ncbi:MAG: hypothetical protein ACREBG_02340 [Pyrinomonadaceae bacterium]
MTTNLSDTSRGFIFLKRLLQPQFVLFGITLVYFLSTLIVVFGEKNNEFLVNQWAFVKTAMIYPFLLLLGCVLILIGRFATLGVALTIAVYVIYAIAYRGFVGVLNTNEAAGPILGTLRIWFDVMPTNLIVQTGLALVILVVSIAQLSRLVRKRKLT